MDESLGSVTTDRVLGGRVTLMQPAKGYRAGLDAALVAAACDAEPGELVMEPGCGVGAVMLAAAERRPGVRFVGLERDPEALSLARRNIAANGLEGRVEAIWADVGAPGGVTAGAYDHAICNPPFFDQPQRLRGPHPAKRGAHIADDGLAAWTSLLVAAVREGGAIVTIHRADRLAELLARLGSKAGSFQIRPVHPFADAPASRVLVRAVRGGRAPLRLLPPLILHPRGGDKHTPEAEAVLRGAAALPWL